MRPTSLPHHVPLPVEQMVEELDALIPHAVVTGPLSQEDPHQLSYEAGRRSVVDQLIVLLNQSEEE